MNYLVFLTALNLSMTARLRLMFRDEGAGAKDVIVMALISALVLPFLQVNLSWVALLAFITVHAGITLWTEKKTDRLSRNRLLLMAGYTAGIGMLASPLFTLQWNAIPSGINRFIHQVLLLVDGTGSIDWIMVHVVLFGLLLIVNEMNIVLRYAFEMLRLQPLGEDEQETDREEYNTGRVIGILERIFVFIFVLLGQYAAIGFILAAKGVARYRDFKSRAFAEYVLIGTLLSTLLAMGVAFLVMFLLRF